MKKDKLIEKIRKACVEANPDLLKLEFGCRIKWNNKEWIIYTTSGDSVGVVSLHDFDKAYPLKMDITKIIGREPTLENIIWAMWKKCGWTQLDKVCACWDYYKTFSQQSIPTLEFIYKLLEGEKQYGIR